MIKETVIRAIGNSSGATIPKPMLDRLHVRQGDTVFVVETDNGILLTPFDPTFAAAMEAYREGMRLYRNAMKELADK
jgi:putative addiction module antidote